MGNKGLTPRDESEWDGGSKRLRRLRDGLKRGDHPAEIVFNMEDSRILNSRNASVSENDSPGYMPGSYGREGPSAVAHENV